MKVQYRSDVSILRLYDFDTAEVRQLLSLCVGLSDGSAQRADLPAEPVNDCRLTLRSGAADRGVLREGAAEHFDCILTPSGWGRVAGLVSPFCDEGDEENAWQYFQWLDETSPVSLLLSQSGHW